MEEQTSEHKTGNEEKDDQFWLLALYGLLEDVKKNEWKEFAEQLSHDNRFTSSHKIMKLITDISKYVDYCIPANTILYRARIYHDNPMEDFIREFYADRSKEGENNGDTQTDKNRTQTINTLLYPTIGLMHRKNEVMENFRKEYDEWLQKPFKGYDGDDSNMPPKDKAIEGRVNPEGISYLYLSEEPETCIYEVRPTIGQNVSVAEFTVNKDLHIYDLDHHFPESIKNGEEYLDTALYEYIGQQFSKPYTNKLLQYLPTQFLGEAIKKMGFDGLRFRSSLHQGGHNIVLFNNQHCTPVSSDYIKVAGINLSFYKPEMYELENIANSLVTIETEASTAKEEQQTE